MLPLWRYDEEEKEGEVEKEEEDSMPDSGIQSDISDWSRCRDDTRLSNSGRVVVTRQINES